VSPPPPVKDAKTNNVVGLTWQLGPIRAVLNTALWKALNFLISKEDKAMKFEVSRKMEIWIVDYGTVLSGRWVL
jgi:hypothetical protein